MSNRTLRFSNLDQIMDEVDRLHRDGYHSTGKWDLGQTCDHLADWMSFGMDGFPKTPWVISLMLGIMRVTQGKRMLHKVLESGKMGSGSPTMPQTVHEKRPNPEASMERLRVTVDRLKRSSGPFHPSPLFGAMTKEELVGLHLVHCAHHLAYLQPQS